MLKVDSSKVGLVRGVYIFSQNRAGCIGIDQAKDENNLDVSVAYTPWHRHDDHPEKAAEELEEIHRCYRRFNSYDGALMYLEYHDYKK